MTTKQIAKLETIINRLEALQAEVKNMRLSGLLAEAKAKLIKADVEAYYAKNHN